MGRGPGGSHYAHPSAALRNCHPAHRTCACRASGRSFHNRACVLHLRHVLLMLLEVCSESTLRGTACPCTSVCIVDVTCVYLQYIVCVLCVVGFCLYAVAVQFSWLLFVYDICCLCESAAPRGIHVCSSVCAWHMMQFLSRSS